MNFESGKEQNLDFKIFKELKENKSYLSGQYLADKFKISRQALWKHIKNLEKCGYKIKATPHRGYKLENSPDKLFSWEVKYNLGTKFIGQAIYFKEIIDSTQDFIRQLAQGGACEGTVVFAGKQKKGKGRMGRSWLSPPGGIYLSCLFRPRFLLIEEVCQISLIMALACIEAIEKETGITPAVKWPNDIYLENKKLGGILCEIDAEADKINFITVGIGININTKNLPPEATSLALYAQKNFSKNSIGKEILRQIETCYLELEKGNSKDLLQRWQQHCFLWGSRLRVKVLEEVVEGEAAGIDQRGCLLLRRDTGLIDTISSGDVIKVM